MELLLFEWNLTCTRQGIHNFFRRYLELGTINKKTGSGERSKVVQEVKNIVEGQMQEDDETTAVQLKAILKKHGYHLSLSTILCCRKSLGWSFRGTSYCQMIQMIREQNNLDEDFGDVIWTDDTTVQMKSHRLYCCRKKSQKPRYKPRYVAIQNSTLIFLIRPFCRPKHPVKVHVWAGIGLSGRSGVYIFEGKMHACLYTEILDGTLLPFIHSRMPDSRRVV